MDRGPLRWPGAPADGDDDDGSVLSAVDDALLEVGWATDEGGDDDDDDVDLFDGGEDEDADELDDECTEELDGDEDEEVLSVSVSTLLGGVFLLEVAPWATVLQLKEMLWQMQGLAVEQQALVLGERELPDAACLAECGVTNGTNLQLVLTVASALTNLVVSAESSLPDFDPYSDLDWPGVDVASFGDEEPVAEDSSLLQLLLGEDAPLTPQSFFVHREGEVLSLLPLSTPPEPPFDDASDFGDDLEPPRSPSPEWSLQHHLRRLQENTRHRLRMAELRARMQQRRRRPPLPHICVDPPPNDHLAAAPPLARRALPLAPSSPARPVRSARSGRSARSTHAAAVASPRLGRAHRVLPQIPAARAAPASMAKPADEPLLAAASTLAPVKTPPRRLPRPPSKPKETHVSEHLRQVRDNVESIRRRLR